jgi:hypothetical protein
VTFSHQHRDAVNTVQPQLLSLELRHELAPNHNKKNSKFVNAVGFRSMEKKHFHEVNQTEKCSAV